MTADMWLTLGILAIAIILFITERLRVDVVALGVVLALMLTDLLTPTEALAGFSNASVITIVALFIVGGGVFQTGLAGMIGQRILKIAGDNEVHLTVVIMLTVAFLSGIMSDTGTVAVLMPVIIGLASSAKISSSKLLIPLSFGSLLGGAMTLIGTPPNIIVSELLQEADPTLGLDSFEFFDYTPVGLVILIAGIGFMVTIGRRLLPDNQLADESQDDHTPDQLAETYELMDKVFYARVRSKSLLQNKSILDSGLRRDYNLTIVEILRPIDAQPIVSFGAQKLVIENSKPQHIFPTGTTILNVDDVLILQGEQADMLRAVKDCTLELQEAQLNAQREALINRHSGIAEVILPPRSSLIGKTLGESRIARTYNVTVLEIKRPRTDTPLDMRTTKLEFGDTLLIQGLWHDIMALKKRRKDFVILGQPETMVGVLRSRKAPIAALVMGGMLIMLIFDIFPLVMVALLASFMMILTGCLSMDEAYEAIDWKSIVLIAGMLPMATALSNVGLVDEIAQQVTNGLGDSGSYIVMAGLFLLTAIFTQVLSNTATAVLVAPIALETAHRLEVSPYAFLMAVAIAASMAFASPVASPVNTLVLGAGNYKFMDYVKIGVPMLGIAFVITMILVPIIFPF